jgi:hypothetical protein
MIYLKYMGKLLPVWLAIIAGWPLVAIAIPFNRGRDHWRWKWFDRIWGNPIDTIRGDNLWRKNQAPDLGGIDSFRSIWLWSAWRNPAKALHLRVGVQGEIETFEVKGDWGRGTAIVRARVSGKDHRFIWMVYKWPFIDRYFELMFGPKIWPEHPVKDSDGNIIAWRQRKPGDYIEEAALALRVRPFVHMDWDTTSISLLET